MRACLTIAAALFASTAAFAQPKDQSLVKIGLSRALGGGTALTITSHSAVRITQGNNTTSIVRATPGSVFKLSACDAGIELDRIDSGDQETVGRYPNPLNFTCDDAGGITATRIAGAGAANSTPRRYRGILTVRKLPDGLLSVIDTVGLEDYLYGVIAPEMGGNAPSEALKAQAVASRTYVLKNLERFADEGFDIDDSTRSQQYDGMDAETPLTIAAVDSTRGQVLTYQGALIDAYYSTDCGGVTAVDTSGEHPYFQAVLDSPGDGQPDYAATSSYKDWDCLFSQADLVKLLNKDPRTKVANFASLTLDSFDASGRITTATVSDTDGTMRTVTGPQLRQILGNDVLRSTRVTLTVKSNGDYVFHGHGWGHGFGMSQEGAIGMASAPYNKSYTDILAHYYVGAQIVDIADVKQ